MRLIKILSAVFVFLLPVNAWSVGTPAGAVINNTVTVDYVANGVPASASDSVALTVHEIIDVVTTWQDAASVPVSSPSANQVLTYLVVNTGNGSEAFSLSVFNADVSDQFDPVNARIYLDNGNSVWEGTAVETLYQPGVNDPVLDANGTDRINIYVLNEIPAALVNGNLGNSRLDVQANTTGAAGATVGTVLAGLGDGAGIDAVVGSSQAQTNTTGTYVVTPGAAVAVSLNKSSSVIANLDGCSVAPCDPNPGATIRYSIQVDVSGAGIAENLVINDVIPANTTYENESMTLDTVYKSDAPDADEGVFNAGAVIMNLGNVTAPASLVITFDVTIN